MNTLSYIEMAHCGDKEAREQVLRENTGLIWSVVKRFLNRGVEKDDLYQLGCIGMIKAIDRFDANFNVAFSTYAVPMIAGEIRRFLRDDGTIKVSRTIKENQIKIMSAVEKLKQKGIAEPSVEEIVKETEISSEDVSIAMTAPTYVDSIYKETSDTGDSTLLDYIADQSDEEEQLLNKMIVKQIIDELDPIEKEIIIDRFFNNKTQSEIAKKIGYTQVQVSRMEKKILKNIRIKYKNQI